MGKKTFLPEDLIQSLKESPHFDSISGTYELSINKTALKKDTPINFSCSDEEMQSFIENVFAALKPLSKVIAKTSPREWAPLPGYKKDTLVNKFLDRPDLYLEFLETDPHIIVIRKISDTGKDIFWKKMSPIVS